MLAVPTTLSAELTQRGVEDMAPPRRLWETIAESLPESARAACKQINDAMQMTFMLTSVASYKNPDILYDDIVEVVTKNGGVKSWVIGLEHLLNHKFTRQANVPASAISALSDVTNMNMINQRPKEDQTYPAKYKDSESLDVMLMRSGQWPPVIPIGALRHAVQGLAPPSMHPLSAHGKRTAKIIKTTLVYWIIAVYGTVARCTPFVRSCCKQLAAEWPDIPCEWWLKVITALFDELRKPSRQEVRRG